MLSPAGTGADNISVNKYQKGSNVTYAACKGFGTLIYKSTSNYLVARGMGGDFNGIGSYLCGPEVN
jgi:hypothetical protein